MLRREWTTSTLAIVAVAAAVSARGAEPIPGIGPTGKLTQVRTGFVFTEGPCADERGDVYFSDVRANTIYKVDTQGKLTTFLENSQGANGLGFDARGRLIAAQGGAK